ncbi:uncharacterized protein LOC143550428 isoform X2 [Bidens hawaiensis]|uniref:uncharacterized protein LOC143550428 isoform X2 n=1 Tax=Bidens hawaiensis TaxID=980011 RepID=UPI00404A4235
MIETCNESSTQPFAKTICSICFEDLKPTVEDLQAISVCGHVFHELCIQQWFEYCSKGKKNCPICKQTCSTSNVSRLYFQSVGDSDGSNHSQKPQTYNHDPEELKLEVRRLEVKISGLSLALESRESEYNTLNNKYSVCKEQLKKETSLKNEAMGQTRTINDLLNLKIQELYKSEQERNKLLEKYKTLQTNNMNLAKEFAALKLGNSNLEEHEIVKYVSLITEHHSKEEVDRFTKLLNDHRKNYHELIKKYKDLGGDEAWDRKKDETSEKKSKVLERLKEKTRQAKTAKAPKKTKDSSGVLNEVDPTLNDTYTPQDTIKKPDVHPRETKRSRVTESVTKSNNKDDDSSYILVSDDDDASKVPISPESPSYDSVSRPTNRTTDDDMACVFEEPLFTAGTLGLDGTKRHLGTYCKKGFNISLVPTQSSGNLINVGPDGRGGTMKVLKPLNSFPNVSRGPLISAKRSKLGTKTSSLQAKGSLKINHYFNKACQ